MYFAMPVMTLYWGGETQVILLNLLKMSDIVNLPAAKSAFIWRTEPRNECRMHFDHNLHRCTIKMHLSCGRNRIHWCESSENQVVSLHLHRGVLIISQNLFSRAVRNQYFRWDCMCQDGWKLIVFYFLKIQSNTKSVIPYRYRYSATAHCLAYWKIIRLLFQSNRSAFTFA